MFLVVPDTNPIARVCIKCKEPILSLRNLASRQLTTPGKQNKIYGFVSPAVSEGLTESKPTGCMRFQLAIWHLAAGLDDSGCEQHQPYVACKCERTLKRTICQNYENINCYLLDQVFGDSVFPSSYVLCALRYSRVPRVSGEQHSQLGNHSSVHN